MSILHTSFTPVGTMKPLHAVGQPPFVGADFHMFQYLADFGCPFSRLHDVQGVYGGGRWVDIPNLFRDFDADPTDPASYDFTFTDLLMNALVDKGIEPFFRLGVTIENQYYIKSYRIDPPKDYQKWAVICEHIIRHYNEGWADGYHLNIRYWEIWNEPDNSHDPKKNQMWTGTMEEYIELYGVAAGHLKKCFPDIRVGGFASCGFYGIKADPNGANYPTLKYYLDFAEAFLAYVKENDCPMDFFSWHSYGSIPDTIAYAEYITGRLEHYGFAGMEQSLNEWNCEPPQRGTARHAALTAGMMLALQDSAVGQAMFYDARFGTSIYGGMFNPLTKEPFPAYYSFMAFAELYRRGIQAALTLDIPGVYAQAAGTAEDGCLVIANTNKEEKALTLALPAGASVTGCKIIDKDRTWTDTAFTDILPGESVVCLWIGR